MLVIFRALYYAYSILKIIEFVITVMAQLQHQTDKLTFTIEYNQKHPFSVVP